MARPVKTRAEKAYDAILSKLSKKQKDQLILECMHILDGPEVWHSGTIEEIAGCFIERGFVIRDPHDLHLFDESELEE